MNVGYAGLGCSTASLTEMGLFDKDWYPKKWTKKTLATEILRHRHALSPHKLVICVVSHEQMCLDSLLTLGFKCITKEEDKSKCKNHPGTATYLLAGNVDEILEECRKAAKPTRKIVNKEIRIP